MRRRMIPLLLCLCMLTGCSLVTEITPPADSTQTTAETTALPAETTVSETEISGTTAPETTTSAPETEHQTTEPPETTASDGTETQTETTASTAASTVLTASATETPRTTTAGTVSTMASTAAAESHTAAPPDALLTAGAIRAMPAGTVLPREQLSERVIAACFAEEPVSGEVLARISGVSYRENPDITPDQLRYLRMLHCTPSGGVQIGEMIVNAGISADVLEIFQALFAADYPIERMVLVDEYGGDDNASMAANNTSAFNYRRIADSAALSRHALGLAIDVNPRYNPYITRRSDGTVRVVPENGQAYTDRAADYPMKITADDLCCQLFLAHGFTWGGSWSNPKDYQHFEKTL